MATPTQVLGGSAGIDEPIGPFAVVIGNFDGVHQGHARLIDRAKEHAERYDCGVLIYTFHPHPAAVLSPMGGPELIETVGQRVERLAEHGVDAVLVEVFDEYYASQSPETFLRDILATKLQARAVIVGTAFRFGKGRSGDVELMKRLGEELGFVVDPVELLELDGEPVSSSRIREAVRDGDVQLAAKLLGRPFAVGGLVMRGDQRGTELGFPTANIGTHNELWPAVGVYAGYVIAEELGRREACINVGYSPTFQVKKLRIEAHILDFEPRPLYGMPVEVSFFRRLRDEKKFSDRAALKSQIEQDLAATRAILGNAR